MILRDLEKNNIIIVIIIINFITPPLAYSVVNCDDHLVLLKVLSAYWSVMMHYYSRAKCFGKLLW